MGKYKKLVKLYNRIPLMKCKRGCNECCNSVIFSEVEASKLSKIHRIALKVAGNSSLRCSDITSNGHCVFASKKGCCIHDVRPFLCRLKGTVKSETLKCEVGGEYQPGDFLSGKTARRLMQEYTSKFFDPVDVAEWRFWLKNQ